MNNKSIIEFGFHRNRIMNTSADLVGCYPPRPKSAEFFIEIPMKAKFNNIANYSKNDYFFVSEIQSHKKRRIRDSFANLSVM